MSSALILAILLTVTVSEGSAAPEPALIPVELRCEYRQNPLGIDAPNPRLSWVLHGSGAARSRNQTAYRILVASSKALLARNQGDLWDSGKVASREQNQVEYRGGRLSSTQTCHWKVKVWEGKSEGPWSEPAHWEMGLLQPQDWTGQWLNDGKPNPIADAEFYKDDPAPLFRKEFTVRRPIARARLYVAGLGYFEPSLNGARVGKEVLEPGWTAFKKRVYYSVHDVTAQLSRGKNCLGVALGNGWYNPLPMRMWGNRNLREDLATGRPRLLAQLRIDYRNGTSETIATDHTWRVGEGPIRRNNIYLGEVYDARLEQAGWDKPGFNAKTWRPPTIASEPVGRLTIPPQPPIRVTKQWKALKVSQPKPGVYIYDCGVNLSGWVRLQLDVPRGSEIRLRYGELLYPDGTLNPMTSVAGQIKGVRQGTNESIGGPGAPPVAWQADTYIARGGGETNTPRFTWRGFRYVEITGLDAPLPVSKITVMRLNSDVEDAGSFECSNPTLNQIQTMVRQTFLSNILSVQSDCPHRERFGYGGDIVATSEAFMDNFDMAGFYTKTVQDWSDAALADGMFTDTAPFVGIQYCGVAWAMAHPLLIGQLHRTYGERRLDEAEYAAAKRWLGLVEKRYPLGIVTEGLSDHEGLEPTPAPALVTPLYFESANLLASAARRLGKRDDEAHFRRLAESIELAYLKQFVDPETGKVGPGTQASQALALSTRIVPSSLRPKVLEMLLQTIRDKSGRLSTGILGTKAMLNELSRAGKTDVAYGIVTQPEFPGWVWMLRNGATTLWEHWEFSDNTFSHNHPMFGSVSQWMMRWLGGIQPDPEAVGYDRIVIQPQTPSGLDWVKSRYRSIRGAIVSQWFREGDKVRFEVEIPINTHAKIVLPASSVESITENGAPLTNATGICNVAHRNGAVEMRVGSGRYRFVVKAG